MTIAQNLHMNSLPPEDQSTRLAEKLQALTEAAIDKLSAVLAEPIDVENGALMRAQTTSAAVALNAQLRADALRLRAARADRTLERLLELIANKELTVPCDVKPARTEAISADTLASQGGASAGITAA